ncbi:Ada metal-binding domain-containing protein [Mucilaginibacter sp.]|jgi:methylphosphotriester-DNA--protein-cysteine methyltransferase|uniref:Ada metal-binding domain-containing protein n=1 Tax=Mucilaginibacter sp. TaxID=1882438 RepID=UPI003567EC97
MILHSDLGQTAFARSRQLKKLLNSGGIKLAGNRKLKIYGTLNCSSGKRIKTENRLFFENETEAIATGYRPCGHCMKDVYQKWKALN